MKLPNTPSDDINNALRLLGMTLPETDEEIEAFLVELDAEEAEEMPDHLSLSAIVAAIKEGRKKMPAGDQILQFPTANDRAGIDGLRMAARNGDGPLSEETLRKMEDAQED